MIIIIIISAPQIQWSSSDIARSINLLTYLLNTGLYQEIFQLFFCLFTSCTVSVERICCEYYHKVICNSFSSNPQGSLGCSPSAYINHYDDIPKGLKQKFLPAGYHSCHSLNSTKILRHCRQWWQSHKTEKEFSALTFKYLILSYQPIQDERLLDRSMIARLLGLLSSERFASEISAVTRVIVMLYRQQSQAQLLT